MYKFLENNKATLFNAIRSNLSHTQNIKDKYLHMSFKKKCPLFMTENGKMFVIKPTVKYNPRKQRNSYIIKISDITRLYRLSILTATSGI